MEQKSCRRLRDSGLLPRKFRRGIGWSEFGTHIAVQRFFQHRLCPFYWDKRSFYRVTTSYLPSSLKKLIFSFGTPRKKTKTLYLSKLLFYNPATPRSKRKDPPLLLSQTPPHPAPRGRPIQPRGQEPEANNPAAPRSKRTDPPPSPLSRALAPRPPGSGYTTPGSRPREQKSAQKRAKRRLSDPGVGRGAGSTTPDPRGGSLYLTPG